MAREARERNAKTGDWRHSIMMIIRPQLGSFIRQADSVLLYWDQFSVGRWGRFDVIYQSLLD